MKEINLNDWEILEIILPLSSNQYNILYRIKNIYIGIWYNVVIIKTTGSIRINHTYSDDKVKVKNVKLVTEVFTSWMKLKEIAE